MKVEFFPHSDMLALYLSHEPATGGGEEVMEGVYFSYDAQDHLVFIEIENASQRVDLREIRKDPRHIVDDGEEPAITYTVSTLAEKLAIEPRTLRKTIKSMRDAGIAVGHQQGPTYPIILTEEDEEKIQQWRETHRPGRPVRKAMIETEV